MGLINYLIQVYLMIQEVKAMMKTSVVFNN